MKAGVIGLGTMGPGMVATMARAGFSVAVSDKSADARKGAILQIEAAWAVLDSLGAANNGSLENVSVHDSLKQAVEGADLVIENVSENLEVKQSVFTELDEVTDADCILASDTSGIPITDLQRGLNHPERVIGMHWSNPPHIIPMIEVIAGRQTAEHVVVACSDIVRSLGLLPILVKKDVPGFVENRILYSVMREAVDLVENGVIDPEALDDCVSWGIGYKLAVIGPCALLDMAGLDIYEAVGSYLNKDLCNRDDVSTWITDRTARGQLGMKTGQGVYQYTPEQIADKRSQRIAQLIAVRQALGDKLQDSLTNSDREG